MSALSRFLDPPRLRVLDMEEERRATWLELFFDLVFVVAVAELGEVLSDDVTLGGFLRFLALFVPVWWAWAGFTFYANRFDTDDLAYRLLIFVAMFAVAALATNVPEAFEGGSAGFALSYVCIRLVLLILYGRAIRFVEEGWALARFYFSVFGLAVVIWLVSLAVPEPARYVLWAVALTIEVSAPVAGWRLLPQAPVDPRHLPERFGLLTIIVLGESVFAVVLGVRDVSWEISPALAAGGGFLAAAAIWWIYFDFLDSSVAGGGLLRGLTLTYAHFFVYAGIAALGVGVKLVILEAGGDEKYMDVAWVFCAGLALCMAALAAIHLVTPPQLLDADVWLRLGTAAAAALVLLPLSFVLPGLAVVWLLAALLVAQVVLELAAHERHAAPG
jgi:low temperature requirement protein LtrA